MELSNLFYQLRNADFPLWSTQCRSGRELDVWQLYEPGVPLRERTLYVLTRAQWQQLSDPIGVPVILVSDVELVIPLGIVVRELPLIRLINFLNDTFTGYQTMWHLAWQREPDMNLLMNRIRQTLGVGATLIDGNMEGVAWSEDILRFSFVRDKEEASSVQAQMIWDRDFYETQNNTDVFLLVNELIDPQPVLMLCYNIFLGNQFCARLALVYTQQWRTEYLRAITRQLGQALTQHYRTSPEHAGQTRKTAAFQEAMDQIVRGNRPVDLLELHQFGWYADQSCLVYLFRFDERFPMTVSREYLHNKLEELSSLLVKQ